MVCGLRLVVDEKNIRLHEQKPVYELIVYDISLK